MTMALIWMVAVLSISMSSAISSFYPSTGSRGEAVRCSATNKPCRMQVDLGGGVTEADLCTCNGANTCSRDWVVDASRVIMRELTSDNMMITLKMMFCTDVQPQTLCNENDTALQVSGWSNLPTEVDFYRCSCADSRPLVLTEKFFQDSRNHMQYVCPNFKRQCNMRRNRRDQCIEERGDRTLYPCKCPTNTACEYDRAALSGQQYMCVRK